MMLEKLTQILMTAFPQADVVADGDGSHFLVRIVSKQFAGQSLLERQRSVYACVNEYIAAGDIHALTIKAYTPEQWSVLEHKTQD